MTKDEMKKWIDGASYTQLLSRWRSAPSGDPMFTGAIGEHYIEVMNRRREEVGPSGHTEASKAIGW